MSTLDKNKATIDRIGQEVPSSGNYYSHRRSLVCEWNTTKGLKQVIRKETRRASKILAVQAGEGFNASDYEGYAREISTEYDGSRYYIKVGGETILDLNIPTMAGVHRYHGSVAVHVGTGDTTYLSAKNARRLATALIQAAKSVETELFSESHVPNTAIFGTGQYNLDIKD